MPDLSLLDRADPETNHSSSLLTRISNRLFGDPRKAPRRLAVLLVFALFGVIVAGVWLLATSTIDTSGSSAPVVGPLLQVLTSVWLIPVLTLWLTRRWVLFRRRRSAGLASDITGWSVATINHLRDEIKTTDGCTRIIASTGDSRDAIEDKIRAALEGEYDDDTVDFWADRNAAHADDFDVDRADFNDRDVTIDLDDIFPDDETEEDADAEDSSADDDVRARLQEGFNAAIALSDEVHEAMSEAATDAAETTAEHTREDREIPWRVRFLEEVKHLWLDLQSGFRTGDALVTFGVPAAVTFVLQLFAVGLWTHPAVYLLFGATSTIAGLTWFTISKRRRQRRLRRYRTDSSADYWLDCAGQFKTVETADVTAYMGFIAGRRYASYDRDEFVRKTARTMHQHVSDECVAPSDLQHYARSLEQMKPNLKGHRENVLRPLILQELKSTVEGADDDLIPKAELAWSAIEQPTTSKIERRLGHDPELVAEEYQWLVEDAHILDERDVEFRDASGEVQTLTLVFPAEKNRLPDVSERHSQFSDRFTDKKGDPVYRLPDVDPRDGLSGFVPTPKAAALFDGTTPNAIARGD